ncbi:MAG: hypothetical protein OXH94_07605 [Rhodospirillales bacterium]|nr:hypothetical protein [Rhodospirillales bacterium]
MTNFFASAARVMPLTRLRPSVADLLTEALAKAEADRALCEKVISTPGD